MKVTVQALLNVLVGRDANELVEIDANGIHVEPTTKVNLLGNITNTVSINITPERAQTRTVVKVSNAKLGWKATDLNTLIDLYNRDLSEARIGETLGRTAKAIQCQLCKLRKKGIITKPTKATTHSIAGV